MYEMIDNYKHKGMRKSLVRKLKTKGIRNEAVLESIGRVPRHFFFETAFLEHAYQDKAFPIGEGQTISQPYTVAFQTDLLQVGEGDRVLEIGTGSGYQACVLMELGVKLYTIEYIEKLSKIAKQKLKLMGYQPHFIVGDGSNGWLNKAPYDAILVTAGAPFVPEVLVSQLAPGGRLVIPVGNRKTQKMVRITLDKSGKTSTDEYSDFCFVPLLGEQGWKK